VKAHEIAEALMPYIRRMPLNNIKNAKGSFAKRMKSVD
jgi:hypothetical protein